MKRRAVSIGLTLLLVAFLIAAFSDVDGSTCEWTWERKGTAPPTSGLVEGDLAFQVNGGDVEFGKAIRQTFSDDLSTKAPKLRAIIDGPPPKGSHLVRFSLTRASIQWTPVWAKADLGGHVVLQAAGKKANDSFDVDVIQTCSGFVSRSAFQKAIPVEIAHRIVSEIAR